MRVSTLFCERLESLGGEDVLSADRVSRSYSSAELTHPVATPAPTVRIVLSAAISSYPDMHVSTLFALLLGLAGPELIVLIDYLFAGSARRGIWRASFRLSRGVVNARTSARICRWT